MITEGSVKPMLLREVVGETLREVRADQGKTLREVSALARVSLGYLSEVERGQKEPSSELLAAICGSLDLPVWMLLAAVSSKMREVEESTRSLPVRVAA